jgi:hypothetical protein
MRARISLVAILRDADLRSDSQDEAEENVLAMQVLQEQRRTAPTVMSGVNDPVAAGLVPSLAPAKPVYLI